MDRWINFNDPNVWWAIGVIVCLNFIWALLPAEWTRPADDWGPTDD